MTVACADMEAGLVGWRSVLAIAAGQVNAWRESEEEARMWWLSLGSSFFGQSRVVALCGWLDGA